MKWFEKKKPKMGDGRIRTIFLFFPMTINGETRWLKTVTILERYMRYPLILYPEYKSGWERIRFMR